MSLKLTLDEVTPIEYIGQPEVERFASYVLENFQPDEKKILVLLPCSAKKPYASSKTQRKYTQTIKEAAGDGYHLIQEATLSGVFGVVPREMEGFDAILDYSFSLNRSKYTRGYHQEILKILSDRVSKFLNEFGMHYIAMISYGRERYHTLAQLANKKTRFDLITLPTEGKPLLSDGLRELHQYIYSLTQMI
jgi:predicted RNA-binding protein